MGYYVNNDYSDPETRETPPDVVQVDRFVFTVPTEDCCTGCKVILRSKVSVHSNLPCNGDQ